MSCVLAPLTPAPTLVAPAPLTPVDINGTQPKTYNGAVTAAERRRAFKQIIVKCVLQLLLIETTHELLQNDDVYGTIPAEHLLRFMGVLDDSYQFARKFNANKELRVALWKVGFMKQLPNLLKQESSSAATLVNVLLRMYQDPRAEHRATRSGVLDRLIPLGSDIIRDFNAIDVETQPRNVAAWTPVVAEVLQGTVGFEDEAVSCYPIRANLSVYISPVNAVPARDRHSGSGDAARDATERSSVLPKSRSRPRTDSARVEDCKDRTKSAVR